LAWSLLGVYRHGRGDASAANPTSQTGPTDNAEAHMRITAILIAALLAGCGTDNSGAGSGGSSGGATVTDAGDDGGAADTGVQDGGAAVSDAGATDTGDPGADGTGADSDKSDTEQADTEQADTEKADTEKADAANADAGPAGGSYCPGKCGTGEALVGPDGDKCYCDGACKQFDDCCPDFVKECDKPGVCGNGKCEPPEDPTTCKVDCEGPPPVGSGSCKDECGNSDGIPTPNGQECYCDASCVDFDDCCKDYVALCGGSTPTTPTTGAPGVFISEIMVRSQSGADDGEYVELHNSATATAKIDGWKLIYKGAVTLTLKGKAGPLEIPGGGYFVIGRSADPKKNHGATPDFVQTTIPLGNNGGELSLKDGKTEVDAVEWTKADVVLGASWQLSADKMDAKSNDVPTSWCPSKAAYGTAGKMGSPGSANAKCP